jgi:hypothetical protein
VGALPICYKSMPTMGSGIDLETWYERFNRLAGGLTPSHHSCRTPGSCCRCARHNSPIHPATSRVPSGQPITPHASRNVPALHAPGPAGQVQFARKG